MAAKTSTGTAVISNIGCSGGSYASPPVNCQSGSQDLTTVLGAMWTLRGVPGGTLTTGCSWQVDVSHDGSTWRQLELGTFGIAAGTLYDAIVELPFPTMFTRVTFFGSNAATNVWAELQKATGIA